MISCDPFGAAALAQLEINRLTARLTVICLYLHHELCPGAPRRLYEEALVFELDSAGIGSRRSVEWLVRHRGVRLNTRVAVDLLADETVALNLTAAGDDRRTREGCLRVFVRSSGIPLGLLVDIQTARPDRVVSTVLPERCSLPSGIG
ncbi:MAG: GxxExxY protein [Opitutaceae bacterium]